MFCIVLLFRCILFAVGDQNYKEQLILKFLPDGNVLAHFEHKISWQKSPTDLAYSKFPKCKHYVHNNYTSTTVLFCHAL